MYCVYMNLIKKYIVVDIYDDRHLGLYICKFNFELLAVIETMLMYLHTKLTTYLTNSLKWCYYYDSQHWTDFKTITKIKETDCATVD